MPRCPKCNAEINDGTKFCHSCGAQIPQMLVCPGCGAQTSSEFTFCNNCGASLTGKPVAQQPVAQQPVAQQPVAQQPVAQQPAAQQPVAQQPAAQQPAAAPKEKKPLPKKAILFGAIGLAVIAVIVVVIILIVSGGKSGGNYALYLKDSEIYFSDLNNANKSTNTKQLTSELFEADISNGYLDNYDEGISAATSISKDGKYFFFPDKIDTSDDGYNLYFREVANSNVPAIKIDSDVRAYTINASGTVVTYIKSYDRALWQFKIGDGSKNKIDDDVIMVKISDDGNKLIYRDGDNDIWLKSGVEDKERLVSDIDSLEYVTEDLTTVYYIMDNSLYKHTIGEDRVKVVPDDIYRVLKIYDSGEIYYLTQDNEEASLMSYVADDLKSADASMKEPSEPKMPDAPERPTRPRQPYSWDYDNRTLYEEALEKYREDYEKYEKALEDYNKAYEAYNEECNRLRDEYYEAYEEYRQKLYRDQMREDLESYNINITNYSLNFFNGTSEVVITEDFVYDSENVAFDSPVILYKAFNESGVEKVKFSEISSIYEVESMARSALTSSTERYIAVKETATAIAAEEAINFRLNDAGTAVYYIDNVAEDKNYGELYCISITDGVVAAPELYDTDVYSGYGMFLGDSKFAYFKEFKNSKGDLYINKTLIDYEVYNRYINYSADLDKVFYFTDWSGEKDRGTLKSYQSEKPVKVADDVYTFTVTPDGRVLYMSNYRQERYKGELYVWSDGQSRKIDDDVFGIIPVRINNSNTLYLY